MEREKKKVDEFEASLAKEEKVLEEIRDSLKGKLVEYISMSSPKADRCVL